MTRHGINPKKFIDWMAVRGWSQRDPDSIHPALSSAIDALWNQDEILLLRHANERSVCHRLAVHLESWFNSNSEADGWNVDCEYNLYGEDEIKRMLVEGTRLTRQGKEPAITPDIIVHQRKRNANHLAIETKWIDRLPTGRAEERITKDLQRLHLFAERESREGVQDFGYAHCVFLALVWTPSSCTTMTFVYGPPE